MKAAFILTMHSFSLKVNIFNQIQPFYPNNQAEMYLIVVFLFGLLHASASLKKHKAFKFAPAKWTPGSGVYDAARCGLPFHANNNVPSTNAKLQRRSKRFCNDGERNRKIQGGQAAEEGQFPWAVALARGEAAKKKFFCTGTLVSKRHVLTAAHCFANEEFALQLCSCGIVTAKEMELVLNETTVSIGSICMDDYKLKGLCKSERRQQFRVKTATYLHFYNGKCCGNDFALLELDVDSEGVPANLANHICLPQLNAFEAFSWHNAHPVSYGWGRDMLSNSKLQHMPVLQTLQYPNIWSHAACMRHVNSTYSAQLDDIMCLMDVQGVKDVCEGDSGGGLTSQQMGTDGIWRWLLLGVVSFGPSCEEEAVRQRVNKPGLYTNMTDHWNRVNKLMGIL